MELWEIKAQALKLMFADSDLRYTRADFENEVVDSNGNTRDKVIRMNDSIRRAIDMFYEYCGGITRIKLVKVLEEGFIDLSEIEDLGLVRDIKLINGKALNFYHDKIDKTLRITSSINCEKVELIYERKRDNIPLAVDDTGYELDNIHIPDDVQNWIPLFIKGEAYEEDEPELAAKARSEYIYFLQGRKMQYSNRQRKVTTR